MQNKWKVHIVIPVPRRASLTPCKQKKRNPVIFFNILAKAVGRCLSIQ
jgi:hypothetical protein